MSDINFLAIFYFFFEKFSEIYYKKDRTNLISFVS